MLVALAGVALLVPAIGVAAPSEDPPVTTPVESTPLPPAPAPPVEPSVTLEVPPEPQEITIQVPVLPDPVVAAPKRTPVRPRAPARRAPTRVERVSESQTQSRADDASVAKEKPKQKAKPKKKLRQPKKPRQTQRTVVAPVTAPQRPVRDRMPVHAVLAARFSTPEAASPANTYGPVLYLGLALAAVLGSLFGLVGAAPVLAGRWPHVFVPVIVARERIVVAGVCLASAALTLAITWVITGPGA